MPNTTIKRDSIQKGSLYYFFNIIWWTVVHRIGHRLGSRSFVFFYPIWVGRAATNVQCIKNPWIQNSSLTPCSIQCWDIAGAEAKNSLQTPSLVSRKACIQCASPFRCGVDDEKNLPFPTLGFRHLRTNDVINYVTDLFLGANCYNFPSTHSDEIFRGRTTKKFTTQLHCVRAAKGEIEKVFLSEQCWQSTPRYENAHQQTEKNRWTHFGGLSSGKRRNSLVQNINKKHMICLPFSASISLPQCCMFIVVHVYVLLLRAISIQNNARRWTQRENTEKH